MRNEMVLLMMLAAASGCRRGEPPVPTPPPVQAGGMHGRGMGPMHRMDSVRPMHGRMHGGMHRRTASAADSAAPAHASQSADPAGSAGAAAACPVPTPALVDEGRRVYARTTCAACHGAEGRGTAVAPDLSDGAWLHGDGSYGSIAAVVTAGVSRPLRYPGGMPPKGGAALTAADVCAVSAYVHSLSAGAAGHEHGS